MGVSDKPAKTSTPVHNLISHRWSPRSFDSKPVEHDRLVSLFEAARWASSSYNAQPWYFIVAAKDDPENYEKILECFVEFNQGWAKNAPVLAISVARLKFEHNGEPNRHAFHDVGQAAARSGDSSHRTGPPGSPDGGYSSGQGPPGIWYSRRI